MENTPFCETHPLAAACGDYCGKCPNYPETCQGCIPELHDDCHFVRCCAGKGIDHCGQCMEMPCDALIAHIPDDREGCYTGYHIDNLIDRRTMALGDWLRREAHRWR